MIAVNAGERVIKTIVRRDQMRDKCRSICFIFVAILLVFAKDVLAKEIVFAISNSEGSLQQQTAAEFTRRVNAEFDENHIENKIVLYHDSAMGSDKQLMWKLKSDLIQLALPSSIMSSFVKEYMIFDLPFFIQGRKHLSRIEKTLLPGELTSAANEQGFQVLAFWENGFRQISNNERPIVKPGDLEGLTIRIPKSQWREKIFRHWGADTVQLGFNQVYAALRNGVVDGQENPYTNIWGAKLYEVQKYISISNHIYSPAFLTVSQRWFNQQGEKTKTILQRVAVQMSEYSRRRGAREEQKLSEKLIEQGMVINAIDRSAFINSSQAIQHEFLQSFPSAKTLIQKVEALKD